MLDQNLRDLATRESTGPFLSLYLDTTRGDDTEKDRIRVLLKNELHKIRENLGGNGSTSNAIERAVRQIESYIENELQPSTRGLAIFACPTDDVFIPIQLPVGVDAELSIGNRPQLRQLALISQRYQPVVVALVDAKTARLFELAFEQVLLEIDLSDPDMPRRHDQGGWSQKKMQRHVQDHIDRHHKEVAEILSKMVDTGSAKHVILSGQDRNLANFRSFLPKRVDEKVIGTLHLDIRAEIDEILTECGALLQTRRAEKLQERLSELDEIAHKNGRGVLGVANTVDAVNQRRLGHLLLAENASARGWKCSRCGTLGVNIPVGCPACGESVLTIELVDELVSAAQLENANVDFVTAGTVLDQHDGVGAFLRF